MNNTTLQQDTRQLELALRENVAGKPQCLRYNPVNGQMVIEPAKNGQVADSQFGLMNRNAMTQWFGGANGEATCVAEPIDAEVVNDNATTVYYDGHIGDFVELPSARTDAPSDNGHVVVGQFGILNGESFRSDFGCEVSVATLSESALGMDDGNAAQGFAHTLGNEGVMRIVRGVADSLAKGTKDNAAFA